MTIQEPATKNTTGIVLTADIVGLPASDSLRISAKPGGCSGFRYDLHFDTQIDPTDLVHENGGVRLVVDEASVVMLSGSTVDFKDLGIEGAGFAIENPNETAHECGCGRAE